jgi:Notch-like protein
VTNTTCESAKIEFACVKNAASTPCIWDVICKEKICKNAPSSKNTHELCNSYLPTCTVNSAGNGC